MMKTNPWKQLSIILGCLTFLVACGVQVLPDVIPEELQLDYKLLASLPEEDVSYTETVKPLLEKRCVVCHGCYDAPCQLKLSSFEGLMRGANPKKIYDGARILPMPPTRLGVDAHTSEEWQAKGFHSVVNGVVEDSATATVEETRLSQSVLYKMLRLKEQYPQARSGLLSNQIDIGLNREQSCTNNEDFEEFAQRNPRWGMPYGMPNLQPDEYKSMVHWIAQGTPNDEVFQPSKKAQAAVNQWEEFLNGTSNKQRLMSRYLYEHLFLGHVHFKGTSDREFYRLVRSTTPTGEPINEVATVRPYDDPKTETVFYRLRPFTASVVSKSHLVYELSNERMARYEELFLAPDYTVDTLPSYDPAVASNPFKVFEDIPNTSKYKFMLDESRFFIGGFMKGPVCRGQVALNVIEDHFWVFFMNPEADVFTNDNSAMAQMEDSLQLPADRESNLALLSIWTDYWPRQKQYREARYEGFIAAGAESKHIDEARSYIWDGNGTNPNAALTAFRHFDSASVSYGLQGDFPETAWVIDYPILERIHYLLVAGFNVYGNVGHQLNTRLYMDFLRMEAEDNFLAFMPSSHRKKIYDSWYQGIRKRLPKQFGTPPQWFDVTWLTGYQTDSPKQEFFEGMESYLGGLSGGGDRINRPSADDQLSFVESNLRKIASIKGEHLEVFPDVTFMRITRDNGTAEAYTLVLNKAYQNISSMFAKEDKRDRKGDTLTVIKGLEGTYPNFFFTVNERDLGDFVSQYEAIRNRQQYERFVAVYGIRRTDSAFWETSDWFHEYQAKQSPVESGLLDLNRYSNR